MAEDSAVDCLSSLPDELLLHILSFIPSTKLRAHTSLLSRRYRHLWTAVPTLEFPLHDFPNPTLYPAAIDRCLSLSSAPSLLRFRADAADFTTPSINDFDRWIRFAASRSVSELALSLYRDCDPLPVFTPSLFLCSGFLSSLKLMSCAIPVPPQKFEGFKSLKTLHLTDVPLSDEMAVAMLADCRLLEKLSLTRCRGLTRLEISSASNPRLGYLNLERMTRKRTEKIAVDAPMLRVFDYDGNIKKLRIGEAPRLSAVQIISRFFQLHENYEDWMQLVSVVADVEVLSVSCWFFEFVIAKHVNRPAWFMNLRELHWIGISITDRNLRALVFCLPECPMLEKLIIHLDYSLQLDKEVKELEDMNVEDDDGSVSEESLLSMDEESSFEDDRDVGLLVPCDPSEYHVDYLPRLKMFTITQFLEDGISMVLVQFVLRKAVVLELLQLTLVPDEMELESLRKLISGFYHASPNVKVDVSELSDVKNQCDYKIFQHLWSF